MIHEGIEKRFLIWEVKEKIRRGKPGEYWKDGMNKCMIERTNGRGCYGQGPTDAEGSYGLKEYNCLV